MVRLAGLAALPDAIADLLTQSLEAAGLGLQHHPEDPRDLLHGQAVRLSFPVPGSPAPGSDAPAGPSSYLGPSEEVRDIHLLAKEVDFDKAARRVALIKECEIEHGPGFFYIQLQVVLFRDSGKGIVAQVEPFLCGLRPLHVEEFGELPSSSPWLGPRRRSIDWIVREGSGRIRLPDLTPGGIDRREPMDHEPG